MRLWAARPSCHWCGETVEVYNCMERIPIKSYCVPIHLVLLDAAGAARGLEIEQQHSGSKKNNSKSNLSETYLLHELHEFPLSLSLSMIS